MSERWQTERMLVARLPLTYWFLKLMLPLARLVGQAERIRKLLAYRRELLQSPATCQLLFRRRPIEIQQECLGHRLAELKLPVLVLQGGRDSAAALAQSKTYAKFVPHARLRVMKRGDRNILAAWPDSIVQEIQLFALAQVRSGSRP
ncbi:MAG: alpha/beta hydrolase [Spirulinaceae cyanobacterium RM2_2_10]|nr:alpha/beta hydrolase [Spirulinaceae cyanobacterium RM2_2_10]